MKNKILIKIRNLSLGLVIILFALFLIIIFTPILLIPRAVIRWLVEDNSLIFEVSESYRRFIEEQE